MQRAPLALAPRGRRRWTRSRTRLFGLGLRFWFRLFLRCRDNDLGKLVLRGCRRQQSRAPQRALNRRARGSAKREKQARTSKFIPDCCNEWPNGRLNRWSRCRGRSKMMGLPRSSVRRRRRVRAARRQISNDRESGERRSARLKCRTLRRDKNEIEKAKMLDCSGRERNRQERRIRQE